MALSQVQCLDDNHINLRTSESKPDFFYSEEQRLALETLIQEGRDAFEDHIKTNNIRCFLSDLELERILNSVQVYSPGSPDDNAKLYGESDGEEVSLQYWPDLSDYSIPQLDIGWPDWASYRGVTRVQVYTQPPYDGQPHIKEVVRKMISQAQKVIAIVMDLFTDMDIFKDILDASFRRKVAVYIILESTGVTHFLRMCEKAGMHTGHLKNLRVRTIRGTEFFSRSSKRVCGNQSQKFMFIDGDKAVSGSYSFTWSASRLDRNLITVLTGQAVEILDSLFQDMYVMSNGVCLSKINLGSAPEPEILRQAVPTLFPTANTALKLINPKYTLVSSCLFTTNGPDQTNANNTKNQNESVKHITEAPTLPLIHPGLLNLEKANMIQYVPTWPDPEPPSDVIGFINIRDTNKPLQAHLMRSELFEVSQAIRFKDNISEPKEPVMACPISKTPSETPAQIQACTETKISEDTERNAKHFDQNQQQERSQSEDLILPLQSPQPETAHVLTGNREDKEALDVMNKENQNSLMSFNAKDETKQILDASQAQPCPAQTPNNPDVKSALESKKAYRDSFDNTDNISVNDKVIMDVDTKPMLAADGIHENGYDTHSSNTNSSITSLSEYYDCFTPLADLRSESDVLITEKQSDLQSSHYQMKNIQQEPEFHCLNSYTAKDTVCLDNKQILFTPKLLKTSCSIIFNFPSAFTTTPVQETLNGKGANESALPYKNSDPAQTPNSGFNFSSTSEEYFECSDTVGFGFDGMINGMETGSQRKDFNRNDLHDALEDFIPAVKLQIQKLTEMTIQEAKHCNPGLSCQKMTEMSIQEVDKHCDPESSCRYVTENGSEKRSVMEMTVNGHLEANNSETVLGTEHDSQPQMDDNIHRRQIQETKVRAFMWPDEPEIILEIQPEKLGTETTTALGLRSKFSVDLMCRAEFETAEKTNTQPILDFQLEEMRTEKSPLIDFQSEINLDLDCEGESVKTVEKTEKPLMRDLQSEVNLNLTFEGESEEIAEKSSVIDLQLEINLKGESVQTTEKTEKPLMRDFQSEVNLDLTFEGESEEIAEKTSVIDLQPEINLDLMCEVESVQTTEKTEKQLMLDLQSEVNLDLMCKGESKEIAEKSSAIDFEPKINLDLLCEGGSVQTTKKLEKQLMRDLQSKVNLDLICDRESEEIAEKTSVIDLQPEVNVHLMCDGESVQISEKSKKSPILDSQLEMNLNVICASILEPSELNGCTSQWVTGIESVRGSAVKDAAVIPKNTAVTKSTDLQNTEEQDNLLANLDSESKHPSNLKSAEHVNEFRLRDVEVSQTGLNPEELREKPEDFETVELLILEDSDLQEFEDKEKNHSDPRKTKTALSTEAKQHKIKPAGLKTVNVRRPTENKFELYSKHGKQTCHLTAPVKKKGERERASAIQVRKNLPEAKPKLDCQVRKQAHQTSNGGLHITKPHSMKDIKLPKAETHGYPPGQPPGQNNPCITASPCPTGEMTTLKSQQIQQRHPSTVQSPNDSTSSTKQPHVQPDRPKTTQSDQHVSRKHSVSTMSPSGALFPRQIKKSKQTKETPASKRKK